MNIIVPFKAVADDQDLVVAPDGTLDRSRARRIVSIYDLNAIEAAAQLAAQHEGSRVVAVTVADAASDDSKLKKNVLSRGVDELIMVTDDSCADLDARSTAVQIASLIEAMDGYDLVVCGDGSADVYAQQVGVQLTHALDAPCITGVSSIKAVDGGIVVDRMLETTVETVEVSLPAVITVTPDVAVPRIPGMKDILAAGKKPSRVDGPRELLPASIEVLAERAPEQAKRKGELYDAAVDGDLDKFIKAVKAAL